jgi:putative ABC transport system ATP-binding protein
MAQLIALEGVGRHYDGGRIVALSDVSLTIEAGETISLNGRSGSGKSTLLHLMAGLDAPSSGSVLFQGEQVGGPSAWARVRAHRIGVIFQSFNLLPTLDVLRNVMVPMLGVEREAAKRRHRATELLEHVGLGHRLAHRPPELSGGERQRVAIARSLANRPVLLLADEPTGNLDSETGRAITDLLIDVAARNGMSLVIATHDDTIAARLGRRIDLLDGRVVGDGGACSIS